jgi:hypothetical protein
MWLGSSGVSWNILCRGNHIAGATSVAIVLGAQALGSRIENNYVGSGPIIDAVTGGSFTSSPPMFNSYGLDVRTYRFWGTLASGGTIPLQLDGSIPGIQSYNMENVGYILSAKALVVNGSVTSGSYHVKIKSSALANPQIDINVTDTNAMHVAGAWIGPSDLQNNPDQFGAGSTLGVEVDPTGLSWSGEVPPNIIVEVTVGFGTAGA